MNVIIRLLIQEALRKGMSEGLAGGKSEGMSKLLLSQVRERFGPIPEVIEQKVRSATLFDLEAWARSFVHARSLDDVFGNATTDRERR